ncbi:MAG TPA: hypothetical protein VE967_19700 [Gemmatimonadaceae bacterium]|nr:hypothetical protein [Gemmatimonadaceae bacterium]
MKHTLTEADVQSLYQAEIMKHERDRRVHGDLPLEEALVRATRTKVFEALHAQLPTPPAASGEDPDDVHYRQKKHGKDLWAEVDRLVREADLGAKS